jgi:hypothetical protein
LTPAKHHRKNDGNSDNNCTFLGFLGKSTTYKAVSLLYHIAQGAKVSAAAVAVTGVLPMTLCQSK